MSAIESTERGDELSALCSMELIFSICLWNIFYFIIDQVDQQQSRLFAIDYFIKIIKQSIIQIQMGNICCMEQSNPSRYRQQPVPTAYRHPGITQKIKTPQQQRIEQQKRLLQDFAYAVRVLKQNSSQFNMPKFKGVYTHHSISHDNISEYLYATLVAQNGDFVPCILKKILKESINNYNINRSIAIENLVTTYHSSAFIVKTLSYYQDNLFLYLYFDLTNFNPLNIYTTNYNQSYNVFFRNDLQNNIRFIIAGVVEGLNYLHSLNIVYRAINNENVVILQDGYPLLTNLSRLHPEKYQPSIVQPHPFISPEEYRGQQVTRAADLWSLGVLMYFMVTGTYPNFNNFVQNQFRPIGISFQLSNLINRLLVIDQGQRIGFSSIIELKSHPFFRNFSWYDFQRRAMLSPFTSSESHLQRVYEERTYDQGCYSQNNYGGIGFGFIAAMLFVDIAAIYLISQAFDHDEPGGNFDEQSYAEPVLGQMQDTGAFGGGDYGGGDWGGDGGGDD